MRVLGAAGDRWHVPPLPECHMTFVVLILYINDVTGVVTYVDYSNIKKPRCCCTQASKAQQSAVRVQVAVGRCVKTAHEAACSVFEILD
jgi:hypothetical protein